MLVVSPRLLLLLLEDGGRPHQNGEVQGLDLLHRELLVQAVLALFGDCVAARCNYATLYF